jgi:hypothetical protein
MWTGLCVGFSSNLCMAVFYTSGGVDGNAGVYKHKWGRLQAEARAKNVVLPVVGSLLAGTARRQPILSAVPGTALTPRRHAIE